MVREQTNPKNTCTHKRKSDNDNVLLEGPTHLSEFGLCGSVVQEDYLARLLVPLVFVEIKALAH